MAYFYNIIVLKANTFRFFFFFKLRQLRSLAVGCGTVGFGTVGLWNTCVFVLAEFRMGHP